MKCALFLFICGLTLVLGSCISTTYRHALGWGRSAKNVAWVNEQEGTTDALYRVGDTLYIKGFVGDADVVHSEPFPSGHLWYAGLWYDTICVTPRPNTVREAWLPLNPDRTEQEIMQMFRRADKYVPLYTTVQNAVYTLPTKAVRVPVPRSRAVHLYPSDAVHVGLNSHYKVEHVQADAHALYAYPLAAALWLGVDVPATVLSPLYVVPATLYAWYDYYD